MVLERRIRRYLNDIIDVAFKNISEDERQKYKDFYLKISSKELKNSSGVYYANKKSIEVYNPSLGARHLAKCALHELSHHIDMCQHGSTGHQKSFYGIYKRLIFAALDMKILEKKDFFDWWSSDKNKVVKIIDEYRPHPVKYTPDNAQTIRVYKAYDIKEQLKASGYYWNKLEQVWEKESDDIEADVKELEQIGVTKEGEGPIYYKIQKSTMYVEAVIYLEAAGETYKNKENLKANGFYYSQKSKKWLKKINVTDQDNIRLHMHKYIGEHSCPGVTYQIVSRK